MSKGWVIRWRNLRLHLTHFRLQRARPSSRSERLPARTGKKECGLRGPWRAG